MNKFWIKLINFLLLLGIVQGYNTTLKSRSQAEEIARLEAALETANIQIANAQINRKTQSDDSEAGAFDKESIYADGVYSAGAQGFGGEIVVEVTIENGKITKLDIVSAAHEDRAYLEAASAVVVNVLKEQSAEVDTVSGATYSSTGIRDAAAAALEKAKK